MKRFSAQYILTNSGPALRRGVITAEDDGTVISIDNTRGNLRESQTVEFYNGIIIPGFVNCHAHLEFSHMRGAIASRIGLGNFIMKARTTREYDPERIISSALSADDELRREGIELCADICNTSATFNIKKKSRVRYINLLEVFGIDPEKADRRMNEIAGVSAEAEKLVLPWFFVPHSVYSVSLSLFRLLKEKTGKNRITSIHFMETEGEKSFLKDHSGPLKKSYADSGILPERLETPADHTAAILHEVTTSGNLILVHNTFADRKTVAETNKRGSTFWCLCPGSNLFIENRVPPVDLLISEGCEIVIGTDSLASNHKLSILSELKILQEHFPSVSLEELIRWATINGARALGEDTKYGKIEPGMKPGLLLLENADLVNFKLLPETTVTRLM
jgi:cytosine/adenosine deaminase-related metal-dependent hydrolase